MADPFVPRQTVSAKELNDVFAPLVATVNTRLTTIQADLKTSLANMLASSTATLTQAISALTTQQQAQAAAQAAAATTVSALSTAQGALAPKLNPVLAGTVVVPTTVLANVGDIAASTQYVRNLFAGSDRSGANVNGAWGLMPDGTLRQRGVISTSATGGQTIIFPKSFSGGYTIVGSVVGNVINTNVFCVSFSGMNSPSGINVYVTLNGAPAAFTVSWIAESL